MAFELDGENIYDGVVGIGVPADSAEISIPTLGITIIFWRERSSVLTGAYDNETSKLVVDGQLNETPGAPIGQYEATFDVDSGFEINP